MNYGAVVAPCPQIAVLVDADDPAGCRRRVGSVLADGDGDYVIVFLDALAGVKSCPGGLGHRHAFAGV